MLALGGTSGVKGKGMGPGGGGGGGGITDVKVWSKNIYNAIIISVHKCNPKRQTLATLSSCKLPVHVHRAHEVIVAFF